MAQTVLDPKSREGRRLLQHVDLVLVCTSVAVAVFGVIMVYSATQAKQQLGGADPQYFAKRQAVFVVIGVGVMLLTTLIDYHRFEELGILAYVGTLAGLFLVMSPVGSAAKGSQRWFQVGGFQLQPSSFAVVALVLVVATYCRRARGEIDARRLLILLVVAGLPMGLVAIQPDLGTSIILGTVLLVMLVVVGVRLQHLAILGLLAVVGIVGVVHFGLLKQYQVDRLTVFVNPSHNSHQAAYNLEQSKTTIGAGGVFGRGLLHGSQTNLSFVPEQHTDFIFTAVGEQLGFVGGATLLALFGIMAWRIWRAAHLSRDLFGTLLCTGVLALLVVSVFENSGMTMGIMPITGIPLPLMSYGGSAVISFFGSIGIVVNVEMRRFR